MTLSLALVAWILLAPTALGVLALRAIGLRFADDRMGFLAWTWPCGALALAISLFAYLWLAVEPSLWWTAPLFAAAALALVAARRRSATPASSGDVARGGWAFAGFAALGAAFCVLQFTAAAARPSVEGDEGNIWTMKAKSLIVDYYGGSGDDGFATAQVWNLHPDYPQLNPILQAWVHAEAGAIVQFENRLPIQLCVLALWLALCAALRRRAPGWLAAGLATTALLAPQFYWLCRSSYADAMVGLGLVLAFDGWLRYRRTARPAWLWLAAIGATFALWSKNEAALYAVATAAAAGLAMIARRARLSAPRAATAGALLLPLCVVTAQALWNRRFALQNDLMGENPLGKSLSQLIVEQFSARAPVVAAEAWRLVSDVTGAFGVLLVVALAPLLWPRAALGRELFVPTLGLLGSFVGLHLVYVGSHLDLMHHLLTSQARVVFQLVPAALVWLAVLTVEQGAASTVASRASLGDDAPA